MDRGDPRAESNDPTALNLLPDSTVATKQDFCFKNRFGEESCISLLLQVWSDCASLLLDREPQEIIQTSSSLSAPGRVHIQRCRCRVACHEGDAQ